MQIANEMAHVTRTAVGIDFSPASIAALDFAQTLARRDEEPAIHAAHAFALPIVPLATGDVLLAADFDRRARSALEQSLRDVVAAHRDPRMPIESIVLDGPAGSALVEYASELGCVRIVVGATGRGVLPRLLVGSTAERIVRTSAIDVVVVPRAHGERSTIRRILCATDFSAASETAILRAIDLARAHDATLELVHGWEPAPHVGHIAGLAESIERELARAIEEMLARHRAPTLKLSATIRRGRAAEVVTALGAERTADLLVVGTTGKTGVDHLLLGSVAERIVRTSTIPVLVARGRSARSPALN